MIQKLIFASALSLLMTACAHQGMRGSVAMKVSDQEAHICVNKDEVKVGQRVAVFKSDCSAGRKESRGTPCEKVKKGEGVVTEILNEHYSAVKFDPGVEFSEGSFIEPL